MSHCDDMLITADTIGQAVLTVCLGTGLWLWLSHLTRYLTELEDTGGLHLGARIAGDRDELRALRTALERDGLMPHHHERLIELEDELAAITDARRANRTLRGLDAELSNLVLSERLDILEARLAHEFSDVCPHDPGVAP